jgi:hypothetical protein
LPGLGGKQRPDGNATPKDIVAKTRSFLWRQQRIIFVDTKKTRLPTEELDEPGTIM